ncbi:MAG: hypothetical protein ACTSSE_16085 [Candidatus Thorarchaeota archaeon]
MQNISEGETMNAIIEDTGMCICGHPRNKHRDKKLRSSCKKCRCTSYTPAVQAAEGLIAKEHEPECTCGPCAWERLMNAERNLLSLKGEIERLDKSLDLEMEASTEMEERLDTFEIDTDKSIEAIQKRQNELEDSIKDLKAKIDEGNKIIVEHHNDNEATIKDIVEYLTSAGYSRKKELIKKMSR